MGVSNESMDILKLLNSAFDRVAKHGEREFYPSDLAGDLQTLNDELVYPNVNNGVYRCGFAKSQKAYDAAVAGLFEALEDLDKRLADYPNLVNFVRDVSQSVEPVRRATNIKHIK